MCLQWQLQGEHHSCTGACPASAYLIWRYHAEPAAAIRRSYLTQYQLEVLLHGRGRGVSCSMTCGSGTWTPCIGRQSETFRLLVDIGQHCPLSPLCFMGVMPWLRHEPWLCHPCKLPYTMHAVSHAMQSSAPAPLPMYATTSSSTLSANKACIDGSALLMMTTAMNAPFVASSR